MAMQFDRMAAYAAIQSMISKDRPDWLAAAQRVVDVGRTLPDEDKVETLARARRAPESECALVAGPYVITHSIEHEYVQCVENRGRTIGARRHFYRVFYEPGTFRPYAVVLVLVEVVSKKHAALLYLWKNILRPWKWHRAPYAMVLRHKTLAAEIIHSTDPELELEHD